MHKPVPKMPAEVAKSVEEVKDGENETPKTPAAKPMVGIIYPPPEVRSILSVITANVTLPNCYCQA